MARIADTSLYGDGTVIAGAAWTGWGVPGAQVPSTGGSGAALAYPSLSLPAHAAADVRIELLTLPASGTFAWYDDTSASLTGASDGAWTCTFRVFIDEVDQGVATAYFFVGGAVAVVGATLDSITCGITAGLPVLATLLATLDGITADVRVSGQPVVASIAAPLGDVVLQATAGTFSFGPARRSYDVYPPLRTIGGQKLG